MQNLLKYMLLIINIFQIIYKWKEYVINIVKNLLTKMNYFIKYILTID